MKWCNRLCSFFKKRAKRMASHPVNGIRPSPSGKVLKQHEKLEAVRHSAKQELKNKRDELTSTIELVVKSRGIYE